MTSLLIFSTLIMVFLWAFQVLFLDTFYKREKTKSIGAVAREIQKIQNEDDFLERVNDLSFEREVCIDITNNSSSLYVSSFFGKGCIRDDLDKRFYMASFISGKEKEASVILVNPSFDNDTLLYAVRLDGDQFAFINTSLVPIDSTVAILQKQLFIITFIVFILSFLISIFISKRLSRPIITLNDQAKSMALGNFSKVFDDESNIYELNELSTTLNYAREELGKTEELRRDLMANVSHDLKTPLTMIKAYAEMCRDLHAKSEAKRREDMNVIISESDRLSLLVGDILELSKMQSNIDEIKMEEFDLISLTEDILKRYQLYTEVENYSFSFLHNEEKVLVFADRKRIEQVIYNLVNNAINYTGDDNQVIIQILSDPDKVRVEVIDHGKGIRDEDLPYIWDRYYKNKKKHKRNLVGTGLGLSIVKKILEQHHFLYGVLSEEGVGTTFYFEIGRKKKRKEKKVA